MFAFRYSNEGDVEDRWVRMSSTPIGESSEVIAHKFRIFYGFYSAWAAVDCLQKLWAGRRTPFARVGSLDMSRWVTPIWLFGSFRLL